jgi:hypothetical protein
LNIQDLLGGELKLNERYPGFLEVLQKANFGGLKK